MKLIDYLRANEITDEAFAAQVGVSKWGVRKWMYGQRVPRTEEMLAIRDATNGAVTPNDFLPADATDNSTEAA